MLLSARARMSAVIPLLLVVLNVRLAKTASHSNGAEVDRPTRICITQNNNKEDCSGSVKNWRPNQGEKFVASWSNPVLLAYIEYVDRPGCTNVQWNVTINAESPTFCQMAVGAYENMDDTQMTWYSVQTFDEDHCSLRAVYNVTLQIHSSSCMKQPDATNRVKFYGAVNSTFALSVSTTSTIDRSTTTIFQPTTRTTPGPPPPTTRSSTKGPPSTPPKCADDVCAVTVGNQTRDIFSTAKTVSNASATAAREPDNSEEITDNGVIELTASTPSLSQRTGISSTPNILATAEVRAAETTVTINPAGRMSTSAQQVSSVISATAAVSGQGRTAISPSAVTSKIDEQSSDASTVRTPSTGGEFVKSGSVTSSSRVESSFQSIATEAASSTSSASWTSASSELSTLPPIGKTSLPVEGSSASPTVSRPTTPGAPTIPSSSSRLPSIGDRTSTGVPSKWPDKQTTTSSSHSYGTTSAVVSSSKRETSSFLVTTTGKAINTSPSQQLSSVASSSSPSSIVTSSSTSFVRSSSTARSTVTAAAARSTVTTAAAGAASVPPAQDTVKISSVPSTSGYHTTASTTAAAVTSQPMTTSVTAFSSSIVAGRSTVTRSTSGSSPRTTGAVEVSGTSVAGVESTSQPASTTTSASAITSQSSSTTSRRKEAMTPPDNSEEDDDTSTVSTPTRAASTTAGEQVQSRSTPQPPTTSRSSSVDVVTTASLSSISKAETSTRAASEVESSTATSTTVLTITSSDSAITLTFAGEFASTASEVGHHTTDSSRTTTSKSSVERESATSVIRSSSRDYTTSVGKSTPEPEHSTITTMTTNDTDAMTNYLVRFRIVNIVFESDYSDVYSPAYNGLNMKLSLMLINVYRVSLGSLLINISNLEFSEGSVIVQHSLLFNGSMDDGMLNRTRSELQRTLARSNLTVDSFEMKPISPSQPTALPKAPPTTDQILLISLVCGLLAVVVACIIAVSILLCRHRVRRRRRSCRSSRGSGTTSTSSDSSSKSSSAHVRRPNFNGPALPRVDAHLWMKNNTIRGMGLGRPTPTTSNYFDRPTQLPRAASDDNYDELPNQNQNQNRQQQKANKQQPNRQQAVDSLRHNKHRLGVEQNSNSEVPSNRQLAEVDQGWQFDAGFGGNWGYFDGVRQQRQTSQQPEQQAADRPVLHGRPLWRPPGYISQRAFGDVDQSTGDHQPQPPPSQDSAVMRRRESASQTDSEILEEIDEIYGRRYTPSRDRNRQRQQALRASRVSAANSAVRPFSSPVGRSQTNSVQANQVGRSQAASPTNSRQPDMLHRNVYLP